MHSLIVLFALSACDDAADPQPEAAPSPQAAAAPTKAEPSAAQKAPPPPPNPPGTWSQLRVAHAEADSFLRSNWNKYNENYHPNYILDGAPETAWVEGVDGNGEHQTIWFPVSALPSARAVKVRIRNGYQKSDALLAANAAPKTLTVSVQHHHEPVAEQTFTLKREMGWQELVVAVPDGKGLDQISLRVGETHPGSKYEDTCISDVELLVDSAIPYNAGQEQKKHDTLTAWIGERVETARYFADAAGGYPFTSTHFDATEQATTRDGADAAMGPGRRTLAALQAVDGWLALSAAHTIPALPDGLWLSDSLRPLFTPKELSFAPAAEALADHSRNEERDGEYVMWSEELWRSNVKITRGPDQQLSSVYFWIKSIEEGRGTYEAKTEYVVHYEDGAIAWIYSRRAGSSEIGPEVSEQMFTFEKRGQKLAPTQRDSMSAYAEAPDASFFDRSRYRG